MNEAQAAFELGCNLSLTRVCQCLDHQHRDAAEYARQVNWNRRYLKPGDGDKLALLREIRDSRPKTLLHLHDVTPSTCSVCVPYYPLTYPDGFRKGPGLYATFQKALIKLGYSKGPEGDYR